MTVPDPIADLLTRIRNAMLAGHTVVALPSSKMKAAIAGILQEEGFIQDFDVAEQEGKPQPVLRLTLKYVGERRERHPGIHGVKRVSHPGRRIYAGKSEIPRVRSGTGGAVLSAPKSGMTGSRARPGGG